MTDIKMKGARQHEEDFAELIGGERVPGSGNQWHNKGDAANGHFTLFAFRADCKSTQGQSIGVSRGMIRKALDEAHGERFALPLRFYRNERLDIEYDLVAVTADDFGELLENARQNAVTRAELEALQAKVARATIVNVPPHLSDDQLAEFGQQLDAALASGVPQLRRPGDAPQEGATFEAMSAALMAAQDRQAELEDQLTQAREEAGDLTRRLASAHDQLDAQATARVVEFVEQHDPAEIERLRAELATRDAHLLQSARENDRVVGLLADAYQELEVLHEERETPQPDEPQQAPEYLPQAPWTIVHQVKLPGGKTALTGTYWDKDCHSHPWPVSEIRIEPHGPDSEWLFVNNRRVREGDLYIGGQLRLRVGAR